MYFLRVLLTFSLLFFTVEIFSQSGRIEISDNINAYNIRSVCVIVKGEYPYKENLSEMRKTMDEEERRYSKGEYMRASRLIPYIDMQYYSLTPLSLNSSIHKTNDERHNSIEKIVYSGVADILLKRGFEVFSENIESKTKIKELCKQLSEKNIDALLIVRYVLKKDRIEAGNFISESTGNSITTSIKVNGYKEGEALIPVIELFDNRSGNIILRQYGFCIKDIFKAIGYQNLDLLFVEKSTNTDSIAGLTLKKFIASDNVKLPLKLSNETRNEKIILKEKRSDYFNRLLYDDGYWHSLNIRFETGVSMNLFNNWDFSENDKLKKYRCKVSSIREPSITIIPVSVSFKNFEISVMPFTIGVGVQADAEYLVDYPEYDEFDTSTMSWNHFPAVSKKIYSKVKTSYLNAGICGLHYCLHLTDRLSFSFGSTQGLNVQSCKHNLIISEKNSMTDEKKIFSFPVTADFSLIYKQIKFQYSYIPELSGGVVKLLFSFGSGSRDFKSKFLQTQGSFRRYN